MSLNILHRRRNIDFGNAPFSFDTKSSTPSNNVFVVRRESDNVEQTFNYTQITDGTFDTFVSGSEGAIKEWIAQDGSGLKQLTNTRQPRLKSGVINPYIDNYAIDKDLQFSRVSNMSGDSIVSVILKDELNNNNQRANVIIRGTGSNLFAFQLTPGSGNVLYDSVGVVVGDYGFNYANNGIFKLFTFTRIGGVKKLYINNVEITQLAGNTTYTLRTDSTTPNMIVIGGRGSGSGKITKYQHLGLVVGAEATATNISTYNTDLMTKYGI